AADRDSTRVNQSLEGEPERRFQTQNSERALLELLHLLAAGVRRMIGGNHVDRARDNTLNHSPYVAFRAQGRLHLIIAVVTGQLGVGDREMMGSGLASHR